MGADPVSIGLMAVKAVGGVVQGISQQKAYNAAAAVDDQNSSNALTQGAFDQLDIEKRLRATQGEALAATAGNGVEVGTGSALDLLKQNAVNAQMDILSRKYEAALTAKNYSDKAAGERKAGRGALFGGILNAGASILTGMQGMGDQSAESSAANRQYLAQRQQPGGIALAIPRMGN
jgi:hypothetical protein